MNELTNLNSLNSLNQLSTDDATKIAASNFLPYLELASGKSKCVEEDHIAYPGDLVLNGQTNLGTSIEVTFINYRTKVCALDKTKNKYAERFVLLRPATLENSVDYKAFTERNLKAGHEIHEGVEVLLFVNGVFATMWLKRTTRGAIVPLTTNGSGRNHKLSTRLIQGRNNKYHVLDALPLSTCAKGVQLAGCTEKTELPDELLSKAMQMFNTVPAMAAISDKAEIND